MKSFYVEYEKNGSKNLDTLVALNLSWVDVKRVLSSTSGILALRSRVLKELHNKDFRTNFD